MISGSLFFAINMMGKPPKKNIQKQLQLISLQKTSPMQPLRNMFDEYANLVAAFLTKKNNANTVITGSLFESNRINLKMFSKIKSFILENELALNSKLKMNGLQAITLPPENFNKNEYENHITLIVKSQLGFLETLHSIHTPKKTGMIIFLLGLFLILFIFFIKSFSKNKKPKNLAYAQKPVAETNTHINEKNNVHIFSQRRKHLMPIENVLSLFLGDLASHSLIKSAALFRYRPGKGKGEWLPRLQRQGSITITGSALSKIKLPTATQLDSGNSVLSLNGERLFIPLMDQGELWGGILLIAKETSIINPITAKELELDVKRFGRSLYEHDSFASIVFDPETGFRSSPLFPIYLKERMLSSGLFHLAIFELIGLETITPESLYAWAQSLCAWLNTKGLPSENVFRIANNRFVIFYENEKMTNEIKHQLHRISIAQLNLRPIGAFMPRNSELEGTENFMRRLEKAMLIARREGGIREYENTFVA